VTRKSKKKLTLLGSMKVPEVWLHDGKGLKFLIRSRTGEYKEKATSRAFPFLTPQDFLQFIEQYGELSEHDLVTGFVKWARRRRKESQK